MASRFCKSLLVWGTPCLLVLFTACGGKKGEPPPPVNLTGPEYPGAKDALNTLQTQMNTAFDKCTKAAAPFVAAAAPVLATNPTLGLGGLAQSGPALAALLTGPANPAMGECSNAVLNAFLNYRTIDNGQYAQRPDTQRWWETAFIRPFGSQFAPFMPPSLLANQPFVNSLTAAGVSFFQNRILPLMAPQRSGPLNSAANQILAQIPPR